jgi:transposase
MKKLKSNVACAGMDVHYKFSKITFRDTGGKIVARQRLDHPDRVKLRQRLSKWPPGIQVIMEASFGWGWLSDLVAEEGMNVDLSNCHKVEQMRRARGWVKTNKKDADLISLLAFEATDWWKVWRAPVDVRNRREQMRFRADLVGIQTAVKSRIHAVFHRHGIFHDFSDLFGAKGRKFLSELCLNNSANLPAEALMSLRGNVRLLDHVRRQLAEAARALRSQMERDPLTMRLKTIPGIGLILAYILAAEIGKIERFRNHKSLAAYSLLAPLADDTGEADPSHSPKGRHLGVRGNRTLKWAFIEAAHGAVRSGGRWRDIFDRVTDGGRRDCGRGYIKVARELVKVVYAVWAKGMDYQEARPVRPGSGKDTNKSKNNSKKMNKNKQSRSETGQLLHPMVHAVSA